MQKLNKQGYFTTRRLVMTGLLFGIILFLHFSKLGFINIGIMSLTIMHVPVIIGAVIEGPKTGAVLGLLFGLFSFITNWTNPGITAFIFMNPVISIGVRVVMGYVSGLVYQAFKTKNATLSAGLSAIIGTLTNTFGVLTLTYLFYANKFAQALQIKPESVLKTLGTIIVSNGIPEAIAAFFIVSAVTLAYFKATGRKN